MLLAINVNNTNTSFGIHQGSAWRAHWRVATDRAKQTDEHAMLLHSLFKFHGLRWSDIEGVAIASVVPPITANFVELARRYLKHEPLLVSHRLKTGVRILLDYPDEIGADRILNALGYEDVPNPEPEPGSGEVLVELKAASLNHLDIWIRKGLPSVPKPRILGADGAGVVAAIGEGVDAFEIGDRVVLNPGIDHGGGRITVIGEHTDGTCCELKALPATQLYPLDDSLSFAEGAAFPLGFETAYRMLVTRAAMREDEWVLIWGIGGGVATAAFELCRALGARTIVTSGSEWKLERARAWGADVTVNHDEEDVVRGIF